MTGPARLTRLTLDRSSWPLGRLVLEAAFRGADGRPVAETNRSFVNLPAPEKVGKMLNNLVTELLNLKGRELSSTTRLEFTNPRNGWIFFSTSVGRRFGEAERAEISVLARNRGYTHRARVPPFSRTRQPWINYYWRIFRAKTPTAKLTISDWATRDEPGGPVGQEWIYNFIEVQPYLAAE